MLLQIDKFQIAVAVVPVTDHTIAAGLQLTGIFLSQRVGSLPRKTICVVVPMAVAETTFKQRLRRAAGQNLTAVAAHQAPLAVLAHRVVFDLGVGLQFPRIAEEPYLIVVQHRRAGLHESLRRLHSVSGGCGSRRRPRRFRRAAASRAVSAVPGRGAAVDGTVAEETAPAAQPVKKSIDKTGNKDLFTVTHRPSFL